MAYDYLGQHQIPALVDPDPVGFVDYTEALSTAVNNGLGGVAATAAQANSEVAADVVALGPGWGPTRIMPADADLDTYSVGGLTRIATPDTATIKNLPPGMRAAGILENLTSGSNSWWIQKVNEYGIGGRQWWRPSINLSGGWGPWALGDAPSTPVTEWHVFLAVGQSNMQGAGLVSTTEAGKYMSLRVAQFGFTRRTLETAQVPLDMHGTASALSPATAFANNYLRNQPDHVGVLLVPAARGGTGFTSSTTTYTWTPNVATSLAYDLPQSAVIQTKDALAAARSTGAIVDLKGILWHQGENNGSLSTSGYAGLLDGLISYFRTELESPFLPFVVGQMVPEGIVANSPGRARVDLAHQQTPGRVIYTGFAPATLGGHNPGDTTHMSRVGVDYLGRTYLEAYGRALANDGTEGVLPDNVAELDSSGKLPAAYFPDSYKPTTNGAAPVGKGELYKNLDDYRLTGDTTDSGAISRAHAANKVVLYPRGKEHDSGFYQNLYGTPYQNALGPRLMSGKAGAPVVDAEPVMWVQKYSSSDRSTNAGEWDQGAFYGALHKESGNSYGAAITGYVRHASADGGQLIGLHGRGQAVLPESQVWGGWSYAFSATEVTPHTVIGHEINIVNKGADQGWKAGGGAGQHRGLVVVTADGSNPVTQGIYIGANSAAPNGYMHTGLKIEGSGIMPADAAISSTAVANNELLQLEGAPVGMQANGIRWRGGRFAVGASFAEATFDNNAAILLGTGQRIVSAAGPGSSRFLEFGSTANPTYLNMSNMVLAFGGVQVLSGRKTGWNATVGTLLRGTFNADTATQAQIAQTLAALITDFRAHGSIGA